MNPTNIVNPNLVIYTKNGERFILINVTFSNEYICGKTTIANRFSMPYLGQETIIPIVNISHCVILNNDELLCEIENAIEKNMLRTGHYGYDDYKKQIDIEMDKIKKFLDKEQK